MQIKVETWTLKEYLSKVDKVENQPEYQRGEVWSDDKKQLLIDSMLRGIDVPKIYLRVTAGNTYEVADGQQRLTTILKFINNQIAIPAGEDKGLPLGIYDGMDLREKYYKDIPKKFKTDLDDYKLTIAVVTGASGDQIRTLFGRLQEGVNLNPAEKRNAILSSTGRHIDNFVFNHTFFEHSRISRSRFKRQDYLAHVIALVAYKNKSDLKSVLLERLYLDKMFVLDQKLLSKVATVLDHMYELDKFLVTRITKKFHFIDLFWMIFQQFDKLGSIDYKGFAAAFDKFEWLRLDVDDPKDLIENPKATQDDRDLYDYYMAFRHDGSSPASIQTRQLIFKKLYKKFI
ncbi:DUF262 domain-containing protein [Mucilaginibacter glaciei]|uniref:DUF262 domain-containing protein n=1 Tax=Mucilaginibacter glaciei TaxID=2772109 RepID=A0A926NQ33_9SPHI|nr:DUF262 domain-containing protein [Mucilaginibacter glaciei]MBD1395241.1 DUF262 domain-containing protein [Mucilaginibacter glaciei]